MEKIYIDLDSLNYNYRNIKYQILYYYPDVIKVEIEEGRVGIWYSDKGYINKNIVKKIIDDNKLHVNIPSNLIDIKMEYLKSDEKNIFLNNF